MHVAATENIIQEQQPDSNSSSIDDVDGLKCKLNSPGLVFLHTSKFKVKFLNHQIAMYYA